MNAEDVLIILPVSNAVLFPGVVLPIAIAGNAALAAAQEAVRTQRRVGLLLGTDPAVGTEGPSAPRAPPRRDPRICIGSALPPASCVSSPRRTVPTI